MASRVEHARGTRKSMIANNVRKAFEQWFEADAWPSEHSNWFRRDDDMDYELDGVQRDWNVWLAAYTTAARSRTPSPEEVAAVARAMCGSDYDNPERAANPHPREWWIDRHWKLYERNARAALAASDAWRSQELEKQGGHADTI